MSKYSFNIINKATREGKGSTNYNGHYIVLVGYNSFRQSFMYHDPAKSESKLQYIITYHSIHIICL